MPASADIQIYPPSMQGTGAFDGGAIVEQKPIGFRGDGAVVQRIGPLFYWAWAHTKKEGSIPSHPHQAFEILTYVIQGEAHHGDSLGTDSLVGPGGAQLIQAGSGVYHNERFTGPDGEVFQIWFEPEMRKALGRTPEYHQYDNEQFPVAERNGVRVKTIIGEGSPITIVADAKMWDVEMSPHSVHEISLSNKRALSGLAIRGYGSCVWETDTESRFQPKDYVVVQTEEPGRITVKAGPEGLRMTWIEVPTEVNYALFPKKR
ncbi:pirin family protein [Paenibacillus sp. J2TS4]|uniref:pirin family protein n=1 Tax=Paenibacillus sp. J2TS4 TaxID=2807194 RepID=UPI001B17946A|nr:pirin family protein [Paenibacillus sp. J2TS4]GIP34024.1 pirin family protein [Paenibacillus sp. J2TS4]